MSKNINQSDKNNKKLSQIIKQELYLGHLTRKERKPAHFQAYLRNGPPAGNAKLAPGPEGPRPCRHQHNTDLHPHR